MGVYIKGMDKPKRCSICPLCRYYHENGNVWCNALNVILESIPYEMRLLDSVLDSIEPHKDCPLVEVKAPHGRLIDARKWHKRLQKQAMTLYGSDNRTYGLIMDIMDAIHTEPTVIEAEVE